MASPAFPVESLHARAYRIPTEGPEQDGTLTWDATVLVTAEVRAGGASGLGYTYADPAAAILIAERLAAVAAGRDALDVPAIGQAMAGAMRNLGETGLGAMAVSAADAALWDLKSRLLGLPLARLLGQVRDSVAVYGSGGFANYSADRMQAQLEGWTERGFRRVKIKVGARPGEDPGRVRAARRAVGPGTELFVDANGAYGCRQALGLAARFAEEGVSWFEEPVPYWDVAGTRFIRERAPGGLGVAGGEYGYRPDEFLLWLQSGALDFLQADATRCGGITGFLTVAALCDAFDVPLSSHCAPSLHIALGCGLRPMRHLEYFHDHARIESLLFDGFRHPERGEVAPDPDRPGLGIEFKAADAEKFAV